MADWVPCSEFTMAEIEHFVDPDAKDHDRFDQVKDIKLRLLPKDVQSAGKTDISEITVGEAVTSVRATCSLARHALTLGCGRA